MQFLWLYIDDFVGKGLQWYVIAELLFYASATFVPLALPLAVLLSSIMTLGNLGERYELVAIKSAGISLRTIMRPLIVFSIILVMSAFYFSNNVMPIANLKFRTLLRDVRLKKPALSISEGEYYKDIEGFIVRVGSKDRNGKMMYNIKIYDHTARNGNLNITMAESGFIEMSKNNQFMLFHLFNGQNYIEQISGSSYYSRPMTRTYFKEQIKRFDLSSFQLTKTDEDVYKNHYKIMNISQLNSSIDTINKELIVKEREFQNLIIKRNKYLSSYYQNRDSVKIFMERRKQKHLTDSINSVNLMDNIVSAPISRTANSAMRTQATVLSSSIDTSSKNAMPKSDGKKAAVEAFNSVMVTKADIDSYSDEFKQTQTSITEHNIEWHRKFTLSFACLAMFLIGAPLGAIIRKGGLGLPLVLSVLIFILFFVISKIGEKSALEGALPVYIGMWIGPFIIFIIGVFFTYKATTDAAIMDADRWHKLLDKIDFIKKKKDEDTANM